MRALVGVLAFLGPTVAGLHTSAVRVLGGDSEREDWPEPLRPRRERVDGLTFRDEGASSPDESIYERGRNGDELGGGQNGVRCVKDLER